MSYTCAGGSTSCAGKYILPIDILAPILCVVEQSLSILVSGGSNGATLSSVSLCVKINPPYLRLFQKKPLPYSAD